MEVLCSAEAVHAKLKLAFGKWSFTFRPESGSPTQQGLAEVSTQSAITEWLPHYAAHSLSNHSTLDFVIGVHRDSDTR